MKKKALWKDIRNSFSNSRGRFISIVLLMVLGSFSLVGLQAVDPDMQVTGRNYFNRLNLFDVSVMSDYGITDDDIKIIDKAHDLSEVEYGYLKDVVIKDSNTSFRIFSKPKEISKFDTVKGRLPNSKSEIAIASTYQDKYKIGDKISFTEKEDFTGKKSLTENKFKIVGFVNSSEISSTVTMGQTSAGTGELNGYAVVVPEVFDSDVYMIARLKFNDTKKVDIYSNKYIDLVQEHKKELKESLKNRPHERLDEIKNEYKKEFIQGKVDLKAVESEISKIDNMSLPSYSIDSRREIPGSDGYKIYQSIFTALESLAMIFPIFLYFVASLVTFTTMTRFVDEERINSGTLKALGYSNGDIIKKFTIYGLIASTIGTAIGVFLGQVVLPKVSYIAYGSAFTIPEVEIHFYWKITLAAFILSLISAVIPAYIVARKELQEKTTELMLPKVPKSGSKILLERIKPLWKRLSFTQKVTARNIFRYKKRMFMTIFGVSGSVALLFTGFAMKNSISGINQRQFGEILHYDLIVAQNSNLDTEKKDELKKLLNSKDIKSESEIYFESVSKTAGDNKDKQEIRMIVPQNTEGFNKYISLLNRKTGKDLEFKKGGAIITERLSTLLNVSIGDVITVQDKDGKDRKLKISGIAEMYMGHFIFMDKDTYEDVYNNKYVTNANLVSLKNRNISNTQKVSAEFMKSSSVVSVVQSSSLINYINTIVASLDMVMQALILAAGLLALVILYNLTNINVSERIRELSTIKVLGFYDGEVTAYIYRETISLSIVGILVGYGLGRWLHTYIMDTVPPDEIMFISELGASSFVIPVVIVSIITALLGFIVNKRLREVDMLAALKSVE
ncbi:ABC transporter permease [Peptostreptococcus faecalis]|uniref:ABC transporter permease n=1 Tax=Peptostreptococcus faecalis TaxID=2045015 RepID=UPI000C79D920|nr:ABC transporter permease [Peptostreptococcus faecalis]